MSSNRAFGFQLLAAQVSDHLLGEWEWQSEEPHVMIGDTKIEKLLFTALAIRCEIGATEFNDLVLAQSEETLLKRQTEQVHPASIRLIVWPQAPVKNRRIDFLISARDWTDPSYTKWRQLIVECDGHDFHERTKEQAARDRSKDRAAVLDGIDSFRFTGSEIWRDPWECAQQITDWALKGFGIT